MKYKFPSCLPSPLAHPYGHMGSPLCPADGGEKPSLGLTDGSIHCFVNAATLRAFRGDPENTGRGKLHCGHSFQE